MGAYQSANGDRHEGEEEPTRTVKVTSDEEEDAYSVVNVSADMIARVKDGTHAVFVAKGRGQPAEGSSSAAAADETLKRALLEERSLTQRLRQDLDVTKAQIAALSARIGAKGKESDSSGNQDEQQARLSALQLEERTLQERLKSEFQSAVDRVSAQFFARGAANEGVCGEVENDVLRCYLDHPQTALNCAGVAEKYEKCVQHYRNELLARQA